ncbi:hypothetical protein LWE61_10290 [Sphingobium sufflavum]|uniref:hypothetical protein n=1 Tax=Sphingobium sufflavum TaxID=1129547 RepID=UPI001F458848|nr:hypothetical protein [Sphingobium sufflavum]MCE7796946.1 hypothetical protein [Sphingobium sufflavum]
MTEAGQGGIALRRRGELTFAGQSIVEYQARQAHAAGAGHALILVDDISPVLTATVDRLAADGIHATLIRDMPTLSRMIGATDQLLLIGDGHIVPESHIELLAHNDHAALLAIPAGPATRSFERIDAEQMWGGALLAPAAMLLRIMDMLGDWDVPLTLLRTAVQDGSARMQCEMADVFDGRITVATTQAAADAATDALARTPQRGTENGGDIDDWPVGAPAARIVPFAIRHGIASTMVRNIAIGLGLLGLVAILGGLVMLGCLLAFFGLVADRVAGQLDRLLRLAMGTRPLDHAMGVIALLVLLATGIIHGDGGPLGAAGATLCVGLIALNILIRRRGIGGDVPEVLKFAPGTALLLLALGGLLNATGTMFAICALLAFASHANQLLRA